MEYYIKSNYFDQYKSKKMFFFKIETCFVYHIIIIYKYTCFGTFLIYNYTRID